MGSIQLDKMFGHISIQQPWLAEQLEADCSDKMPSQLGRDNPTCFGATLWGM